MLLLQVATLVVGISLLAPIEATLGGDNAGFLGADPNAPSSKGNEFILGFMGNTANAPVNTASASLLVTTDDPTASVEFTVEYFGTTQTFEARKGDVTQVSLPVGMTGQIGDIRVNGEDERNKGIRVKATDPTKLLTVYGINDAEVSTDAFLALPCHSYPVVQYRYFVFSTSTISMTGTFRSRFLIVPCEDATSVTLRPTQQIQANTDLTGSPVPTLVNAGDQVTIRVNRLQTAQFNSDMDLTGTVIESDKPISVFVGHECGQVPTGQTACDHLVEQIPPDATWGTQFFTAPLDIRESGERYRVGSIVDNNQVTVTCTTEGQSSPSQEITQTLPLQNGQTYMEFDTVGDAPDGVTPSYRREYCCIETTKPAIVMMYSKGHSLDEITLPGVTGTQGDPFMLLIPPLSQYSNDYTATTAKQVQTGFLGHISLTLPIQFFDNTAVSRSRLTVNGTTYFPDSGYSPILCSNNQVCGYGAYSGLPVGSHQVNYNMSGAAMNLFVYGFLREISFGYPTGFEMQSVGVPRITIFNITVLESVGTVRIPINRTGGDLSRGSVIRAVSRDVPGQAVVGVDYVRLADRGDGNGFRIRWLADQVDPRYVPTPTGNDPAFEIAIIDDSIPEPPGREYFEIDLTLNPSGGNRNGFFYPRAVGRVTIIDDDSPPQIGFDPASYSYDEAAGVARLTITTNMPLRFTDATGALFYTEDGTATAADYTGVARANAVPITFPAGSTETVIEVPITDDELVEGTERFLGQIISGGGIADLDITAPTATVDITDNDNLVFGFEQPSYSFSESVGVANLGVRLSPESGTLSMPLVFTFTTEAGSAMAPGDYASENTLYTFMPGDTRLDIPVTIVDDSDFEDQEQFLGRLSTSNPDAVIDVPTTQVFIDDNDLIPIGFDPVSYSRDEGDGFVDLTFRKFSNPPSLMDNITVVFSTADGTAEAGPAGDYIVISGLEVTFLPEEETKTVRVMINDDSNLENRENFFGNLMISSTSADIAEVTVPQATVDIDDNDQRIEVGFDPTTYSVTEGGTATLTVVLNMAYTEDITVSFQTNPGSAGDPDDYTGVTTVVMFPAGETAQTVDVPTIDDNDSEGTESFTATLSNASPSNVVFITEDTATVNIVDNDNVPVTFDRPSYTVNESSSTVRICFSTTAGHPDRDITVMIQPRQLSAGDPCTDYPTATVNSDFDGGPYSQTFSASSMGGQLCADIDLIPDTLYEGNEQFIVEFTNVPDSANRVDVGAISQTCVTILDDDEPTFNFETPNITIPEPDGPAQICITMTGRTTVPISVTATTGPKSGAPDQATAGSDYEATTFMLVFTPSDEGTTTRCANVPIIDDQLGNEPFEAFSVSFVSISPAGEEGPDKETCVFIEDDDVPEIIWIDRNVTIPEGEYMELCFMSDIGTAVPYDVTVDVRAKGGNPASAADYMVESVLDFTFSSMDPGEVMCVNVSAVDDDIDEPTEQFEFYFTPILDDAPVTFGDPSTACVNIQDDDMPLAQWEVPEVNIPEGGTEQICFIRTADSAQSYEIQVGVRGKGPRPATGDDYSVLIDLNFMIEPGSLRRHCIALSIVQDEIGEGMEQFEFFFENLPNEMAGVGTPATTCINIIDDDVVEVNIDMVNVTVPESDPMVEICFSLSSGISESIVVTAETGPKDGANQATAGLDYSNTTLMVMFPPSAGGQMACGNVPIMDDNLGNEGDELFSVIITSVSGDKVMIGPNDESCVTILDDDMPVIEWDDSVVNITEGESRQICFSSDIGSDVPYEVMVGVRQKGSPALRGTDYTIDSSLNVPIAATNSGDQFCLDVNTIQDNIAEGTEQFELYFENLPSEFATAGTRDTVCVSIVDDEDPEVNVNVPNIDVPEEQPEVEVCISVNTGFAQQVVVTIETGPKAGSSNPATADVDYTTTTRFLTFMPSENGQSVCGRVPIIDDSLANEGTEPFSVRITSVSNSRLRIGQNAETCVNIIDNDVPVITWDDSQVTIPEGENRQVCFSSDIGTAQPYDVMVGAREKGASPATRDVDYSLPAQSLSVTFSSMNGEQFCIDISTIQDTIGEGTEQFELYFENLPSAFANAGDPDVLCVNIVDDDVPVVDVEQPNISVPENETEVKVCLRLSTGITEQVIVTVATGEKTGALGPLATAGDDYVSTTSMLTFMPSDDRQRVCTTVPLTDDNLDEPNELFSVRIIDISPENSVMMGPNSESCVTIIDDDVPVISWDEREVTVPEGGNRQVCFSSDIGTVQPYDVMVGAREKGASPATRDVDYSLPAQSLSVTFSSMNGEQFCIDISAIEDTIGEPTEQFELYFENLPSMSALAGDPNVLCVNIQDNDVPTVIVERPNVTVPENETKVEICLVLSTGIAERVVVTAETGPKTGAADQATADSDYATTTLMITFEPSSDGQRVCGPVPIIDDLLDEANEQFSVRITSVSNDNINMGMNDETCVIIIDDDVPEFNIGPPMVTVPEPDGMVEVCITTDSPLARNIVVTAVTGPKSGADNQATAGDDYSTTTIMVTFMPSDQGVQKLCGIVPIIDDMIGNEPNETLSVTLISSDPPGAKFGDRESCITIIDDDVVGIDFSTMDVVVNENNGTVTVCLTKNVTTAGPITVEFDAEEETGVSNPASDTTDFQPGLGTVVFRPNDTEACGQVVIKDDNTPESPEVFMVTFTVPDLVIPRPPELEPPMAEVTIIDDDNITVIDVLTCQFDETQLVQRFTTTSDYRFMGPCEYTAVSSCNAIPGFDVRVTVDYISETLENGAVGLHVNNLRYVSREDGSFDDGGQTPQSSTPSFDEYSADGGTLVRVSMGSGQTNITFDSNTPSSDPLDTDIFIVHNWGDVDPTILISIRTPNNSEISNFCGLCGSRSGSLLRRDGTEADVTSMTEVQSFITSYAVPARDQILRPQRIECGIVRNDTVIGDPLYAAPVYTEGGREYSLCYEVFGRANSTLNLVSDTCVNVNALYGPMDNPEQGNIIRAVGVRAKGLSDSSCHNIRVDLEGCSANVETPDGNSQSLASMESFESDGISVRKYPSRVRISAPNCDNVMLVMWVICENRNNQDMIKFVIARGLNLRPSSHGLLGQFWNIPVTYTRYNGSADLPAGTDPSRVYVVTVQPESSPARSFLGHFYHLKWDKTREPCLYVGNAQGGPSYEVPDPNDSVIEGRYRDYIFQGGDENLFATSYTYSQFKEGLCN